MTSQPDNIEAISAAPREWAELRWLLVLCQAAAVLITWPLWQARSGGMPNLPVWEGMPAWLNVDCQWLMLASLGLVLVRPLLGALVHGGVLLLAIVLDQMRIQPEFVSLAILLGGAAGSAAGAFVARAHLVALWLFAGLHKLLSHDFWFDSGPENFLDPFPQLPQQVAIGLAVALAAFELLIGVLAVVPASRKLAAWGACLLHGGILLSLMSRGWNQAVWPWNVALALAGFAFFWNWNDSPVTAFRERAWAWRVAALVVLASPLLFYVDRLDAYLCHCVYTDNTPRATLYHANGEGEYISTRSYAALQVPFPPVHRLFEQFFRRVAQPGEVLEIEDPRGWAKRRGYAERTLNYQAPEKEG